MASAPPSIHKLSDEATLAAIVVGDKTESGEITFENVNGTEIVKNRDGLRAHCEPLLTALNKMKKNSTAKEIRVTMIHVQSGQSAGVPVESGWEVEVIPVRAASGSPSVGKQELRLGKYAHLTEQCEVTGDMYAVLLLSKMR